MMFNPDELKRLAHGLASGTTTLRLAEAVGCERRVLRRELESEGGHLLRQMAQAADPDEFTAEEIAQLLAVDKLPNERSDNEHLRHAFASTMRRVWGEWFRRRDVEMALNAEKRKAEAEREIMLEERRARHAARVVEKHAECERADYWNLQTLCELQRREWEDGTPDERRRGLDTDEKRERHRRRHGIKWSCTGFGVYYAEAWSANRCALMYAINGHFLDVMDNPSFAKAWREIEDEQSEKVAQAYEANPMKRRDPKLPTTEAAARALFEKLRPAPPPTADE